MRLELTTFLFRRQIGCSFVRLDLGLALFPFEPMVLVAQTLDFFGLLLNGGRQVFHQIHQIQDHLANRFIFNSGRIEVL